MINSPLYHEVSYYPPSGSHLVGNTIIEQYSAVEGAFYSIISIANETLNPTGSVLPQNYEGYPIFEISRYKLGGSFGNFGNPKGDQFGANVLEMTLAVDNIGRTDLYNQNPFMFSLKTAAYTILGDDELTMLTSDKTYLNNVDWDANANQQNSTDQWFGLVYDDENQKFQLNYWFSGRIDPYLVKGHYHMY